MGFIKEFKEFAMRGNVMDMAVGVIIGGAFGKIVSSLVDDVIMPLVGKAVGNVDFTSLFINLSNDTKYAGSSQGGRCFCFCLWTVHSEHRRLHHCGLLYLLDAEGYQQTDEPEEEKGRGTCRARGSEGSHSGRTAC